MTLLLTFELGRAGQGKGVLLEVPLACPAAAQLWIVKEGREVWPSRDLVAVVG